MNNRLGEVDMGYGCLTAAPRDAQIRALIAIHGDFDTDFDIDLDTGLGGRRPDRWWGVVGGSARRRRE